MLPRNRRIAFPNRHRPPSSSSRPTTPLLVLFLACALACDGKPLVCPACGREVHERTAAVLTLEDGTRISMCCPRCAARRDGEEYRTVTVTVRDFETGDRVDADRAILVQGSDVHTCRGPILRPLRDDAGGQLLPVYDRCEPSVVAFTRHEAALSFISVQGGWITDWPSLVQAQGTP